MNGNERRGEETKGGREKKREKRICKMRIEEMGK